MSKRGRRFVTGPIGGRGRLRGVLAFHGFKPRRRRERSDAILERFQHHVGLRETGRLDRDTTRLLNALRCSHPVRARSGAQEAKALRSSHFQPARLHTASSSGATPEIHVDPAAIGPGHPYEVVHARWSRRLIHYTLVGHAPQNLEPAGWGAVRRAFESWNEAGVVRLAEATDPSQAQIRVLWTPGPSPDRTSIDPFFGPGGAVAVGYYPFFQLGELAGDLHFDTSEPWSLGPRPGCLDLETVALHEIGHCLGIAHARSQGSIMWPAYKELQRKPTAADAIELERIYENAPV